MERPSYKPLAQAAIAAGGCHLLDAHNPVPVRADSSALEVMTDLAKIPAATISPNDSLPEANQSMLLRGVRLLLVAASDGRIRGVVTANDLLGEKPVLVAQNRGIQLRSVESKLEGKMDIRGILGIDSDVRNGYDDIKVTFKIDADASKKDIEALVAQSQKRSAVYDVITNPVNVTVEVA